MAEALFRDLVRGRADYEVKSAGVGAYPGDAASRHTADILAEMGVDMSAFRSRQITPELLDAATHIFALSKSHIAAIESAFPELTDEIHFVSDLGEG